MKNRADTRNRLLRVFLCHTSADKPTVRDLYKQLIADGTDAWLDEEKLLPGQNWDFEIRNAVRNSDVVIVCLSSKSVNKEGYVQKEIKLALDVADEKPEGTIFIVPVRLENCLVPDRLSTYQWANLFEKGGYEKIVGALNRRAEDIGVISSRTNGPKTEMPLNILVTGGKETSEGVLHLAYLVGQQVVLRNHILVDNGTGGVDTAAAEGALAACRSNNLNPRDVIQVYRPEKSPRPAFEYGNLQIIGKNYDERHYAVIQKSHAIVLLGGGDGTMRIARRAELLEKPIIPIGIGRSDETAVILWRELQGKKIISSDDLVLIGPEQKNDRAIAISAVAIAECLARKQLA
jgi:uncharacterized protein (TIGR00725 family)